MDIARDISKSLPEKLVIAKVLIFASGIDRSVF
jgi:hypothetical protein